MFPIWQSVLNPRLVRRILALAPADWADETNGRSNKRHYRTIPLLGVQELCESRGGRPGLPVPNKPDGICRRKATLKQTNSICGQTGGPGATRRGWLKTQKAQQSPTVRRSRLQPSRLGPATEPRRKLGGASETDHPQLAPLVQSLIAMTTERLSVLCNNQGGRW